MALSDTVLAAAIKAALLADSDSCAQDNDALTALCSAIASAVVTHITTLGTVVPGTLTAPPGGGPVTGLGRIL
jgi:hypothetical protein